MTRGPATALAVTALAVAALAVAACKKAPAEDDPGESGPVAVVCTPARVASMSDRVTLRGVVGVPPDRDAVVAPAAAGRLLAVAVLEGDTVEKGALLATVDDPSLAPAVRETDAARAAAQANLADAEAALARAHRLVDQGIAPRRQLEDAEARHAGALAAVKAAAAHGDLARGQQARARVVAPIAGVVVHVFRRTGELVDGTPATPVAEIADPAKLVLRADVPAADLVRVQAGAPVEIALDALPESPLHGRITFVSPAVDPATSLGSVRAAIEPPKDPAVRLKLGLAGEIHVSITPRAGVVVVPAVAVRRSTDGREEVVVCAGRGAAMKAEVREVTVGGRQGDLAEIAHGLAAGDRVVTEHLVGLEDGAAIKESAAPPPAAGAPR
jgi:RND family efflux transporter MFP subunit